jgi:hypothetical protein
LDTRQEKEVATRQTLYEHMTRWMSVGSVSLAGYTW